MRPSTDCLPILERLNVSRETLERLGAFAELLVKWNRRINLVSGADVEHLWMRHIIDSLQCIPLLPPKIERAIDLGSGGGFPGLILAIAAQVSYVLIESDQRKAAFLREAARMTEADVEVLPVRIESADTSPAPLITARALASLDQLLAFSTKLAAADAVFLFLKGKTVDDELTLARQRWHMHLDRFPSLTSPTSCLLRIRDVTSII